MKTDNKVEINYTLKSDGTYAYLYQCNFTYKNPRKLGTLVKNAVTMMEWNQVSRMVIYIPDELVNKNFVEVRPTIIEE